MIAGLDHVEIAIPRDGEERARAFYAGLLGLKEIPKPDQLLANGGLWFGAQGVQLHIGIADTFIPTVAKRGAAVIEARGLSSAASAANAAIGHVRDWLQGSNGKWVTMGVPSDGSYGIPVDVMYGVPVTTANGEYTRVAGLEIDAFSRAKMDATLKELEEERAAIENI